MISRLLGNDFPKDKWVTNLLTRINELIDWVRRVEANIPTIPPEVAETLAEYHVKIGDASEVPIAVDTNALGDIKADSVGGLTLKNGAIDATALFAAGAEASTSNRGLVSTGSQAFAGDKTFAGAVVLSSLTGSNTTTLKSGGAFSNGDANTLNIQEGNTGNNSAIFGSVKNANNTGATGFIGLRRGNTNFDYYWTDNSGNLEVSSTFGNVGSTSGSYVGTQTSDVRLKTDIVDAPYGLQAVLELRPRLFSYKCSPDKRELGFIAQEVESLVPEVVKTTGDSCGDVENVRRMDYARLTVILVKAVQELEQQNQELRKRLDDAGL